MLDATTPPSLAALKTMRFALQLFPNAGRIGLGRIYPARTESIVVPALGLGYRGRR